MALTIKEIDYAKPQAKSYKLVDGGGLCLLIAPSGSKLWRWRYSFEGKEKMMALGEYPVVTLAEARDLHFAGRKLLASGVNPVEKRKAVVEATQEAAAAAAREVENTFEKIAQQWWEWWSEGKAPRHADTVWHRLKGDVFPAYGAKSIDAVTAADVREVMLAIDARGAHDLAKRARETTSQIFRFAIARGLAARNPAMDFQPGDILAEVQVKNQARVSASDLPDLLAAMDGYTGDDVTRYALQLMALTFVRTSELIQAPWSEFDLAHARWNIPGPRMKMKLPHVVPLAPQTVALLRELKKITGKGELVFPGAVEPTQSISTNTLLFALYRMGYKGKMTGHGFRGVASTVLSEHGYEEAHIELQLAHTKKNKVAAAYNHAKYLKQRTEMMQWWADYLDVALAKGRKAA
jgi:integrase